MFLVFMREVVVLDCTRLHIFLVIIVTNLIKTLMRDPLRIPLGIIIVVVLEVFRNKHMIFILGESMSSAFKGLLLGGT